MPMLVGLGEGLLVAPCQRIETRSLAGDVQQQDVGEVGDHPVHGGMQRLAVEQRQVQQQPWLAAPACQHRAEAGRQRHRRRHAAFARQALEPRPVLGGDFHPLARDANLLDLRRFAGQRQPRCVRQTARALHPERLGLLAGRLVLLRRLGQIAAEIVVAGDRRQALAANQRRQFIEHQAEARGIEHQQVDVRVQAVMPVGQQAELEIEVLAMLDSQNPVAMTRTHGQQVGLALGGRSAAQVVQRQAAPAGTGAALLAAIVQKRHRQHGMPFDQRADGLLQSIGIQTLAVELLVQMAADTAQRLVGRTPHQVGVLHGRQVEGVPIGHGRPDDSGGEAAPLGSGGAARAAGAVAGQSCSSWLHPRTVGCW